jgi:hypothetical protein
LFTSVQADYHHTEHTPGGIVQTSPIAAAPAAIAAPSEAATEALHVSAHLDMLEAAQH